MSRKDYTNNLLLQYYQASKDDTEVGEVLEYIETDGTQYYDLNILSNNELGLDITYSYPSISSSINAGIIGIYTPGDKYNPRRDMFFITTNSGTTNSTISIFHQNSSFQSDVSCVQNTFYNVTINWMNNGKIIFNSIDTNIIESSQVSNYLRLFGRYNYYNSTWSYTKARLQSLKLTQGTTLIHDYVPFLDAHLRPCLYDRVTKTRLYHKNISGNTVPTYKRWNKYEVEYLESTGTQYIDTGVYINNQSDITIDCCISAVGGGQSFGGVNPLMTFTTVGPQTSSGNNRFRYNNIQYDMSAGSAFVRSKKRFIK